MWLKFAFGDARLTAVREAHPHDGTGQDRSVLHPSNGMKWCGNGTETATVVRNRPDREVRTRCASLDDIQTTHRRSCREFQLALTQLLSHAHHAAHLWRDRALGSASYLDIITKHNLANSYVSLSTSTLILTTGIYVVFLPTHT